MLTTQCLDLLVTYREAFNMNIGNKTPIGAEKILTFSQKSTSSLLAFDSKKGFYFPPLNDSNRFSTVDYDAHIIGKIEHSIDIVYLSMSIRVLNTIHHIYGLERTHLLVLLAMSVQNPQLACYLLNGNCRNFLYIEGSTFIWLSSIFFHLCIRLTCFLIVYQYTIKIL